MTLLSYLYATGFLIFVSIHCHAEVNDKILSCYIKGNKLYKDFNITNLDPFMCTHITYAFVGLENYTVVTSKIQEELVSESGLGLYSKLTALKRINPRLKILVAINLSSKNSRFARTPALRKHFISSVINFLREHKLDGFDVLPFEELGDVINLLWELKEEFDKSGYILTASIECSPGIIDADDNDSRVREIGRIVHWVSLRCYDYLSINENIIANKKGFHVIDPLKSNNKINIENCVTYFLRHVRRDKLLLATITFGFAFLNENKSGEPAPSDVDNNYRLMSYEETCRLFEKEVWNKTWDEPTLTPIAVKESNKISYANKKSIKLKAQFVVRQRMKGMAVWSLNKDDFLGVCSQPHNLKFPLIYTIKEEFDNRKYITVAVEDYS